MEKEIRPPISLTEKQKQQRVMASNATYSCALGGSRSGKTFFYCYAIVCRALRVKSRHLIVRRHAVDVKNAIGSDTLPKVLKLLKLEKGAHHSYNKVEGILTFKNGSQIYLYGLDDGRGLDKILGMEFSTIYGNEVSEFTYSAIDILKTRLAENSGLPLRFYFDCNPPSTRHWVHRLFVEAVDPVTSEKLNKENYPHVLMNPEDNKENLPKNYIDDVLKTMSLRAQNRFLHGRFSNDKENALFEERFIKRYDPPEFERIVVAVDPAISTDVGSDETGIITAAKGIDGRYYVLDDQSGKMSPQNWAGRAVKMYHTSGSDALVAEVNQGGDMVKTIVQGVPGGENVNFQKVWASKGKYLRAEPVAALYQRGLVSHPQPLFELESQMLEFKIDFDRKREGYSPDRLDALVWALTFLAKLDKDKVNRVEVGVIEW